MAVQNNIFPLFFTLERVHNGYILTAKEETGGVKEAAFRKEVVAEDKINSRIGQLLHLDAMVKERSVVFHVEAVGESTYQLESSLPADELMEAKLAYVHIGSRNCVDGSVMSLLVKDTNTIEVYGMEAERVAKINNLPLSRVGGVPMLSFPNTKEGKKSLSSYFGRTLLTEASNKEIMNWYASHKVCLEKTANKS